MAARSARVVLEEIVFLFSGSFSRATLKTLKVKGDAIKVQERLAMLLRDFDGTLLKFYFQPGDISFFGVADLPRSAVTRWVHSIVESGFAADGTFQLNRIRTDPKDIDTELARAGRLEQPWPPATLAD